MDSANATLKAKTKECRKGIALGTRMTAVVPATPLAAGVPPYHQAAQVYSDVPIRYACAAFDRLHYLTRCVVGSIPG